MQTTIKTAEFVTPKHPDKQCDIIADSILDAYMAQDPKSRVAIEVMGGHGLVTVTGEVTSTAKIDVEKIIKEVAGQSYECNIRIVQQSSYIAQGVDDGGAGDQGIMVGYATRETPSRMPLEYQLARDLCYKLFSKYPFDGKTQVTIEGNRIKTIVASFCHTKSAELLADVKSIFKADEYLINPAGEWEQGGFDADSGLSGRKLIVDNYGPEKCIGGGSFSGKDWTKVDRSGAYMARRLAVDLLEMNKCQEVKVRLAYAIGKAKPVMAEAEIDGKSYRQVMTHDALLGYDLSPKGIYDFLKLGKVKFADTAKFGHFGNGFSWK